ncbi:unnamed protein product (macronuclear) [Paramecium tetraurelia]|uniref:Uncharacterized protein n=1 Tax=Paramecium tetraurelia TaxID=5888 RepID=A0DL84_PARTE|nr:uncharacterized protein GSPATT00018118001 [Paramecium tetraurelia]CAK83801.1 unnamed protein product [Paramecium tetraurelia]|eukprot:XP_001451198.1 hypothetical protein (macronuclear) [Paramecium tetraurelia strain d4-2]
MATLNVHINLNHYQLILQQEKMKNGYQLQKKEFPVGPINFYEQRFNSVNFSNTKINEVIGWILIIAVILLMLMMAISLIQGSVVGFAIPLLSVVTFFIVYMNWVSMKFFVNS